MKLENIIGIELDSKLPNLGTMLAMPRYGITAIGSKLANNGYNVKILAETYGKVTLTDILNSKPDIIMFNGIKTSIDRIKILAIQIKEKMPDIPILIGGEEATMYPNSVKDFVDYIITNEGDETVLKLAESLKKEKEPEKVRGIIYQKEKRWQYTGIPERVKNIDYHLVPGIFSGIEKVGKGLLARWGLTKGLKAISFPIQTSRGCKYNCSFCTQKQLFGNIGYFERNIEFVLDDIKQLTDQGIYHFTVVDNLFGGDKNKTIGFLKGIIKQYENQNKKPNFTVLMRADQFDGNGYSDKELVIMNHAGIKNISIGMESVNKETLKHIKKGEDVYDYIRVAERLKESGIETTGTFGVGGGQDTKMDIYSIVKFAKQSGIDNIHLYAFTIVPGTSEYENNKYQLIQNVPNKYMNGHGVAIFPKKMLPSELQEGTLNAMANFYSLRRIKGVFYRMQIRKIKKSLEGHTKILKRIERDMINKGIYSRNPKTDDWELNEELAKQNPIDYQQFK